MFGARRWCATASLLAQVVFTGPAFGSDSPSTVVVSSNISDVRLTRALVLIRGELSALGVDLQMRVADSPDAPAAPDANDRLTLDVQEGQIVVRVFLAGAQAPLVESVDLDGPDVTAEVIAVRAVEALRAARLLPSPSQRAATPNPPAEHPPAEHPPAEHPPAEHPSAEQPSVAANVSPVPTLQLSLGPSFVQNSQGLPQLSAQAAVLVGPSWGFVALGDYLSVSGLVYVRSARSGED
jgi:hypothetical protein